MSPALSDRLGKSLEWLADAIPDGPAYPNGFIAMNSAENWLVRPDIMPVMKEAVQTNFVAQHLNYAKNPGGEPDLLRALAAFFNKFFNPRVPVAPEHIVTGAGGAAILDSIDFAICDLEDGMLIDAPMWEGFGLASSLRNGDRLIPVTRLPPDATSVEIKRHYVAAMKAAPCRIRGIIVCNPQNPYGHIYPNYWLEALLQFCEEQDLHYISDEIYGQSTWGPSKNERLWSEKANPNIIESPETTFTSVLSLDLSKLQIDPSRVHVLHGISKDLGCSGLRLGFLVTQHNPQIRQAMWILNRYRVSSASSIMGLGLFSDLLHLESILVRGKVALRNAADYVGDFLAFHQICFYKPVAGVFIWARLGGSAATKESDARLWESFAASGVALAYGKAFHETELGWFRITFALPQRDLEEGVRRIENGLGVRRKWQPPLDRQKASTSRVLTRKPKAGKCRSCCVM